MNEILFEQFVLVASMELHGKSMLLLLVVELGPTLCTTALKGSLKSLGKKKKLDATTADTKGSGNLMNRRALGMKLLYLIFLYISELDASIEAGIVDGYAIGCVWHLNPGGIVGSLSTCIIKNMSE